MGISLVTILFQLLNVAILIGIILLVVRLVRFFSDTEKSLRNIESKLQLLEQKLDKQDEK